LMGLTREDMKLQLIDMAGKLVATTSLLQGSTIAYFDTNTLYSGQYVIRISNSSSNITKKVVVMKD